MVLQMLFVILLSYYFPDCTIMAEGGAVLWPFFLHLLFRLIYTRQVVISHMKLENKFHLPKVNHHVPASYLLNLLNLKSEKLAPSKAAIQRLLELK